MAVSSMPAPHTHADASGRERDDVRSVVISNLPREGELRMHGLAALPS
jgi:hypothetical protein